MKTKTLARLGATLMILAANLAGAADGAEDARLDAYFNRYLTEQLQQQPTLATRLGDHRYDALMDDLSPQARRARVELARRTLKALPGAVDYRKLSRDGQIDFEIFRHDLEYDIWLAANTKPFEEDPRTFGSYVSDGVYTLLTQSTLPRETNIANAITRMGQIPGVISAARATLTHPPKPLLETAIRQNRGAIAFYETEIFQLAGETQQLPALREASARTVALLRDYQGFLEGELMSRATGDWRLGKKHFSQKLEYALFSGQTAEQVVADAEKESARVHNDLYVISRQLWSRYFPQVALPSDDATGRHEVVAKVMEAVGHEHGAPDTLVADARATVEKIKGFIRDHDYLRLPDPDRCAVIEMPEFRRGNSVAYLENAPPLDPEAASFYAVSPPPADWSAERVKSLMEEYNRHMLQVLTIHEAYPGHYVQLEYSHRNSSPIRRVLQSGAFIEGWAVYGEQTMLDQGYGDGDLALRLMQLKFYLRAVVNAILDYRMHTTQMTDDEAMKLLQDDSFQSEGEARLKIIRAKQSSTQLSTYFVGRMAHYRTRQQIERELGDKFSLGRYHEAVLSQGSIPVKYLPEVVHRRLQQPR